MRGFMVAALLAQAIDTRVLVTTPGGGPAYIPSEASEASAVLGGIIEASSLNGQPTGEWLRVEMVLKRTKRKPVAYEMDYIRSTTEVDAKARPVWNTNGTPSDACASEMRNALERVREAWAPRPPKPSDGSWGWLAPSHDPCWNECVNQSCGEPCDLRKVSFACLRCFADEAATREREANAQKAREEVAREALDAADAACQPEAKPAKEQSPGAALYFDVPPCVGGAPPPPCVPREVGTIVDAETLIGTRECSESVGTTLSKRKIVDCGPGR